MEQQPLGIGVIGAGHILKRHATAYAALPKLARLVGVADIDAKRAAAAKEQHGFAHSYTDYHELLARPDVQVISVCTPAGLHARMVIDAIRASKHVLCEKPMTTTPAQADEIIEAGKKNPAPKVSFVFQMRTDAIEPGSLITNNAAQC